MQIVGDTRNTNTPGGGRQGAAGCLVLLVGAAVVIGLVWGGVALVRSFIAYEPPIGYDEATTQPVTEASERPCSTVGTTIPDLPESERLDVEAQLEHSALGTAVGMACDTDVKVECDPEADCTASYGDEKVVLDVIRGRCTTWAVIDEQSCEYRMVAMNRFLTQHNLNSRFWSRFREDAEDGALLRCDTIPGGVDLLPGDRGGGSAAPGETKTKYRCYTREPGHLTHTYRVIAGSGTHLDFVEEED